MPGVEIVISSAPLVPLVPDQVPDAEQLVALVEDQVKETIVLSNTDEEDADKEAVGLGSGAGAPPPPPPHETTNKRTKKVGIYFLKYNLNNCTNHKKKMSIYINT